MNEREFELRIEYRMTCSKSAPENICHDIERDDGFYWKNAYGGELEKQINTMGIREIISISDSINKIQECIEKVIIPDGCEAVLVNLILYLPGSSGCNGSLRRNVSFEYFNDSDRNKNL